MILVWPPSATPSSGVLLLLTKSTLVSLRYVFTRWPAHAQLRKDEGRRLLMFTCIDTRRDTFITGHVTNRREREMQNSSQFTPASIFGVNRLPLITPKFHHSSLGHKERYRSKPIIPMSNRCFCGDLHEPSSTGIIPSNRNIGWNVCGRDNPSRN